MRKNPMAFRIMTYSRVALERKVNLYSNGTVVTIQLTVPYLVPTIYGTVKVKVQLCSSKCLLIDVFLFIRVAVKIII